MNETNPDSVENKTASSEVQQQCFEQGTSIPPSPNSPSGAPASSISSNQDQSNVQPSEGRIQPADKWMIGVNAAIAFFSLCGIAIAAGGVIVAHYQWETMQGQLEEMKGTGKQTDDLIAQVTEQAKAANRLAEIARDSLAESRRHFQADQRPYIISNIAPLAPKIGASLEARVSMINYGKTPALQVGTYAAVLIGPDALKQADRWFANDRQQKFDTSIGNIIPPGIPIGLSREIPISSIKKLAPDDMEALIAKDNHAVFVARHLYFDTAGNSFGTDSCYRLLKGWVTAFCERHNEIHEDYKDRSSGEQQASKPASSQ